MASKRKTSGKRKTQRKGLSGNPQRRAGQLRAKRERNDHLASVLRAPEVVYQKMEPAPWWADSHERVLAAARAAEWPSDLPGIERRACEVAGDEFCDRIQAWESGLHATHWLAELAVRAGAELRAAVADDRPEWPRLWAFLRGLALIAPRQSPFAEDWDRVIARMEMPLDEDPFEVAQAETVGAGRLLAGRGLVPDPVIDGLTVTYGARAAGEPVFGRDSYGSRFLLTAPFEYPDGGNHWYAWDIDMCGNEWVVGAGAFGSAEEALAEWRDAVGAAASGAALESCPESVYLTLLDTCVESGPRPDMIDGSEQRALIREFWRLRQRARALAWGEGHAIDEVPVLGQTYDYTPDYHRFQAWYAEQHPDVPEDLGQDLVSVVDNWGPRGQPDAASFHACSPHRIQVASTLIRDLFIPEYANAALRLLPDWTRWCLTQGGLSPDSVFAARALRAARGEAGNPVTDDRRNTPNPDDKSFRQTE